LFFPSLLAIGDPPKKNSLQFIIILFYISPIFLIKKKARTSTYKLCSSSELAVDAAAEDLQIEENFVCEFGALFRHRFCFFALVA
jgi:hypothetical protein